MGCNRCCLHQSMRVVNLVVNLCGICMIVYSLWLQKMWDVGFAKVFPSATLPRPWFIYTCFGVGIGVCLSTLVGCMVASSITNSTLCIYKYIITLSSFLLLQIGAIAVIFFKIDWETQIAQFIDENHRKFDQFINIHVKICRLTVIVAIFAQVHVVAFALIFWATGTEPITNPRWSMIRTNIAQSFLVPPDQSSLPEAECCKNCEELSRTNRYRSFSSYLNGVFRHRRTTTSLIM